MIETLSIGAQHLIDTAFKDREKRDREIGGSLFDAVVTEAAALDRDDAEYLVTSAWHLIEHAHGGTDDSLVDVREGYHARLTDYVLAGAKALDKAA
jgi:hypothetical protein